MKVLVISKKDLECYQIKNVISISFITTHVTIVGETTTTWALNDYMIQLLW